MKIKLITDSACDLDLRWLKDNDVEVLPLLVDIDGVVYKDRVEIEPLEFYKKLKGNTVSCKTAAINPDVFETCFTKYLKDYDKVIYIGMSSTLSCTFQNANIAKNMIESEDIILIDTLGLSIGYGMIVERLVEEIKRDISLEEILKIADEYKDVKYLFTSGSFDMLKRSGRVSSTVATIGTLLNIKPLLNFEDGRVGTYKKTKGNKKMIKEYVEYAKKFCVKKETLCLSHANAEEIIIPLKEKLMEEFELEDIKVYNIGAVIVAHNGEGSIGMYFR